MDILEKSREKVGTKFLLEHSEHLSFDDRPNNNSNSTRNTQKVGKSRDARTKLLDEHDMSDYPSSFSLCCTREPQKVGKSRDKIGKMRDDVYCSTCNYMARDSYNYNKHITSKKHMRNVVPGKVTTNVDSSNNIVIDKNILFSLMKDNSDFKTMLVEQSRELTNQFIAYTSEQSKELTNQFISFAKDQNEKMLEHSDKLLALATKQNSVTHMTNTINKQRYNFNLFLNEKCKDAMNIDDFMNSLEVGLEQLHYFGEHGYVNGITKILTDGLNKLDIYKRPLHCTDLKRDIMHVKDNGEWNRDTENKYIKRLIDNVSIRNARTLAKWQTDTPECAISNSAMCKLWYSLTRGTFNNGGAVGERNEMEIIKNINKNVYIEKGYALSL